MLAGTGDTANITVKWDGAPAIICGINPENGKFFVGTKSVFNVTPKINYTVRDIKQEPWWCCSTKTNCMFSTIIQT